MGTVVRDGGGPGQGTGSVRVGRGTVAKISDLSPRATGQEDIPSSLGRDRWKWSLGQFHITELQTQGLSPSQGADQQGLGQWGAQPDRACLMGAYCVPGPEPGSERADKVTATQSSLWELMINGVDRLAIVTRL